MFSSMTHPRETGVSWKPELPTAAQPSIRGGAASGQEGGMTSVLFTTVRISRGARALPTAAGVTTVDGPARGRFSRPAA